MKKLYFLLLVLLTMSLVGCGNENNENKKKSPTTPEADTLAVMAIDEDTVLEVTQPQSPDLSKSDMVMLDKGRLFFYNSQTQEMVPYEAETDSVVNAIFVGDKLYYCVPEDGMVVLKSLAMDDSIAMPVKEADWGVRYEKCVSETYETVSPLEYYASRHLLGLWHEFSWDSYSMVKQKLFNINTGKVTDWKYETLEEGEDDQMVEESLGDLRIEDDNYWIVDGIDYVCLTDKIDFTQFVSDPDYASEREYSFISLSPDKTKVLYAAILEWGDLPHGILALSSIDGTFQMPLEDTDCTGFIADWLADGSLVYVGEEPLSPDDPDYDANWHYRAHCIKRVYPNGNVEIIAHCSDFQVRK